MTSKVYTKKFKINLIPISDVVLKVCMKVRLLASLNSLEVDVGGNLSHIRYIHHKPLKIALERNDLATKRMSSS